MCNIGVRPTVEGTTKTIEANVLDYDKNLYGEKVTLFFFKRMREERKFDSINDLREQLTKDEAACRAFFS